MAFHNKGSIPLKITPFSRLLQRIQTFTEDTIDHSLQIGKNSIHQRHTVETDHLLFNVKRENVRATDSGHVSGTNVNLSKGNSTDFAHKDQFACHKGVLLSL